MSFIPKKILVTGGAGFIGSHFITLMLRKYPDIFVVNLDKLTYAANLDNLLCCHSNPSYRFIKGDINDETLIKNILIKHQIDTIVHFAAESHVDKSIEDPAAFMKTNIMGTYNLLENARLYWDAAFNLSAEKCRFHHVSTDEVFGSLNSTEKAFTESSQYSPNSPYSASKAASDHIVRSYFKTYGLPNTISNCSNNYGLNQHNEKFIPKIIECCFEQNPIPIYDTGSNIRDWLHVDDHCEAIDLIVRKSNVGEQFVIGGDSEISNLALARLICKIMDGLVAENQPHERLIHFVNDRPGHDWRYAINFSKLQKNLNWSPTINLSDGLQALVKTKVMDFVE